MSKKSHCHECYHFKLNTGFIPELRGSFVLRNLLHGEKQSMKLFVYGSLQHSLVWRRLVGRDCSEQHAVLKGWKAVKVKNHDYPGLIQADDGRVLGMLKTGLSAADFEILDKFEGEQYQRILLVIADSEGQPQQAYVYVFKECYLTQLSSEIWSYQEFSQQCLPRFLHEYL